MSIAKSRAEIVDEGFLEAVAAMKVPSTKATCALDADVALALARSQFLSRHLDLVARAMRRTGHGYYTIGSSGHEGNVAVAHASRVSDPAFLHYRSGAFFVERARQGGYAHAVRDVMLGMCAARREPIAGGRHKVWGSVELAIPPQTSTIASHLPKAVGMAIAIEKRAALGAPVGSSVPADAVVLCSFGDASLQHSTAQGAINSAAYLAFQGRPVPIVFVCEDNGIGISVPTASGWVAASARARAEVKYVYANGRSLDEAVAGAREAIDHARTTRGPVFLHLETARLLGHAGSDVELSYHNEAKIRADEARDPLLVTARVLVDAHHATPADVAALYEAARAEVEEMRLRVVDEEGLRDADDVMAPLRWPMSVQGSSVGSSTSPPERLSLSAQINHVLADVATASPDVLIFGEDVGRKGGIYGVTRRLQKLLGDERVFDTHLDEQFVLGLAMGAGHLGFVSVAEIPYLAFIHNAVDQLRGEAATLPFFSQRQFANPFVVRLPSYGYQKGFGGHFHNDNSIAALLDIPGLIIASPCRGDDAAAMLRTCIDHAREHGRTSIFLEPIALYNTADLESGDGRWLTSYAADENAELGRAGWWSEEGVDGGILMITFANGVLMSLRVAARLKARGIRASVFDLRWLRPLPILDLIEACACHRAVLIVDETRATGGVGENVIAELLAAGYRGPIARVAAKDSFIPLGPAADHVLLSEREIEDAAVALGL